MAAPKRLTAYEGLIKLIRCNMRLKKQRFEAPFLVVRGFAVFLLELVAPIGQALARPEQGGGGDTGRLYCRTPSAHHSVERPAL